MAGGSLGIGEVKIIDIAKSIKERCKAEGASMICKGFVCRREAATSRLLTAAQEKEGSAAAKEKEATERLQAAHTQEEMLRAELHKAASAQETAQSETQQAFRVYFSSWGWDSLCS